MNKEEQELREKVFQALGKASMCWNPIPSGEFDSSKAQNIGNELMKEIRVLIPPRQEVMSEEEIKSVCSEDPSECEALRLYNGYQIVEERVKALSGRIAKPAPIMPEAYPEDSAVNVLRQIRDILKVPEGTNIVAWVRMLKNISEQHTSETENKLVGILSAYCRETGKNESAVDTLFRLEDELLRFRRTARPEPQKTVERVRDLPSEERQNMGNVCERVLWDRTQELINAVNALRQKTEEGR